MDTAPQPTDDTVTLDPIDALLERARLFILDLIMFVDGIFARLGDVPLSAKLARHLTRHALAPTEIALRRAILILAAGLPVPVLRANGPRVIPDAARPRASAVSQQETKPRPPRFCMSEPAPRARNGDKTHPETEYLTEDQLPRILVLTDAVLFALPAPQKPIPALKDPAASFCRRLAALHAAFNNAQGEAERWARRRVRAMARPGAVQRALPVPLTLPRLRKSVKRDDRALLRELTDTINTCFCHNTS
jgi:hypothetical protein